MAFLSCEKRRSLFFNIGLLASFLFISTLILSFKSTFLRKIVLTSSLSFTSWFDLITELIHKNFRRCNDRFWDSLSNYPDLVINYTVSLIYPNVNDKGGKVERVFFMDPEKVIDSEYVDQHTEWPDDTFYLEPPLHQKEGEDLIPGIKDVQHLIMKHQFPSTCKDKKFIVSTQSDSGFGSFLHIAGAILGLALDSDKIFIWGPNDPPFVQGPYCGRPPTQTQQLHLQQMFNRSHTNKTRPTLYYADANIPESSNCIFESISNCSFHDALKMQSIEFLSLSDNHVVPNIIKPIIARLKLPDDLSYFYWRMCAAAFMYRPNSISNQWIKEYEEDYLVNPSDSYDVSIHIRHGDKSSEMRLVEASQLKGALQVIRKLLNKDILNVFLSTEDELVIHDLIKYPKLRVTYFDFQLFNGSVMSQPEYANVIVPQMLCNLKHSLFSNFVIGTIGSNWNRLIIELRAARTGFASNYYFEVGDHKCLSVQHCKFLNTEFDMNW